MFHHAIKSRFPEMLEPFGVAKPFHQLRADRVVAFDKRSAVPRFCKGIVTIAAQRPHRGTIVGTVNASSYVAAFFFFLDGAAVFAKRIRVLVFMAASGAWSHVLRAPFSTI